MSSACGSADVLEALGVNINLSKEQAEEVYKKTGIVFMMAPLFHPALKQISLVRKALKVRTIFNLLGPLCNPAGTERQVIGVPSVAIAQKMSAVVQKLKYKRVMIVTADGMDEVSTRRMTHVFDVHGKQVKRMTIDPQKLGFKRPDLKSLLGGDAKKNAEIVKAILRGEKGPARDIVVLNSACGLLVADTVKNIHDGITMAEESIDAGRALKSLSNLVSATQNYV